LATRHPLSVSEVNFFFAPSGPAQRLFQEPPAKSNFLGASLSDLKKFKKRRQYAAVNWPLHTSCCGRRVGRLENIQTNV
jgi:hypothetical protein